MRVPALTGLFSDTLGVASIAVVPGDVTTIETSEPHGVPDGGNAPVTIVDAPTPSKITDAALQPNGDVILITQHDHDLTTRPDDRVVAFNATASLRGFTDPNLNGALELVSVENRDAFTVRPANPVAEVVLNGNEEQLTNLEFELVGWHKVTATSPTTLTFPTPPNVQRSYTADVVVASHRLRIFGAESGDLVVKKYVLGDERLVDNDCVMFIVPRENIRNRGQYLGEHHPSSAYNPTIEDGFDIYVAIPGAAASGGVAPLDLAHGEILRAIMRTFNGLRIPDWPGFPLAKIRDAEMVTHGRVSYDGPTYLHQYAFDVLVELTPDDRVLPFEAADLGNADSVHRVGAPAFRDLVLTGVKQKDRPGLLTASVQLDDQ